MLIYRADDAISQSVIVKTDAGAQIAEILFILTNTNMVNQRQLDSDQEILQVYIDMYDHEKHRSRKLIKNLHSPFLMLTLIRKKK